MNKSIYRVYLSLLLLLPVFVNAQLNHFIYLQTEGKQPFYAKLDKKIYSSSAAGHLIIPKLKDGSYNIVIGFPKTEKQEQRYTCTINHKDAGYLLKNFGEKGWGLFNLQTLDVVMADGESKESPVVTKEKTDDFSNMLSDVVNDPAIKEVKITEKEPKQPEAKKIETVEQSPVNSVAEDAAAATAAGKELVAASPESGQIGHSTIIKKVMITGADGTEIIYIDVSGGQQDTIRVFIPAEKEGTGKVVNDAVIEEKQEKGAGKAMQDVPAAQVPPIAAESNSDTLKEAGIAKKDDGNEKAVKKEERDEADKKFLPIEMKPSVKEADLQETSKASPMVNSNCTNYATDDDFLKLRKKMAAASADDDMLAAAQKTFKAKCFSTEQVKNLSVLFLSDAGKYKFFDLAYAFVYDSQNYRSLESLLTDGYYISRFKAMISR